MTKLHKVQAIILVAGMGTRLKSKQPKPFVLLNKKPLFFYALKVLAKSHLIDSIVLVAHKDYLEKFRKLIRVFKFRKVKAVVAGGKVRQQSVFNGLQTIDCDTDIVLVHDGARPFISEAMIKNAVDLCIQKRAVIAAVPVKPTIKRVNLKTKQVVETLRREELWEVQTPQVFEKQLLLKAHQHGKKLQATDDAFLVEQLGVKVSIVQGSYTNIKITTTEDLDLAESLLKQKR